MNTDDHAAGAGQRAQHDSAVGLRGPFGFRFWSVWLRATCAGVVVFGLALAFLSDSTVLRLLLVAPSDAVFWGAAPIDPATIAFQRFVYGVLGATVAGWGTLMWVVASTAFRRREAWAWQGLTVALLVWFVPDTAISSFHGVWPNVALNVCLAALLAAPLLATRRAFNRSAVAG